MSCGGEHCPTEGCDGVNSFFRYVCDTVESTLEGETGEWQNCEDSGYLKEEFQGIFCSECEQKVG